MISFLLKALSQFLAQCLILFSLLSFMVMPLQASLFKVVEFKELSAANEPVFLRFDAEGSPTATVKIYLAPVDLVLGGNVIGEPSKDPYKTYIFTVPINNPIIEISSERERILPISLNLEKLNNAPLHIGSTYRMFLSLLEASDVAKHTAEPNNDERDILRRAEEAYDSENYSLACNLAQEAIEYPEAQNIIGNLYAQGFLGIKNEYEALDWYLAAAKADFPKALNALGVMYEYGRGPNKNSYSAKEYYEKAAKLGYAKAQCNLGHMLYDQRNYIQAVEWYRKAAAQNFPRGWNNLGVCYAEGNGLPKNPEKAVECYRKAAEMDYEIGQYNLGRCYLRGLGVDVNRDEARKWLQKAAAKGHKTATRLLSTEF